MNTSTPSPSRSRRSDPLAMPENHLDVVVTPGSIDTGRPASLRTVLGAVIAMPLFFLLAFTLCYVSAGHAPVPHDMALTIAGPASVTESVSDAVLDRTDTAFDITQTPDAAAAREAVLQRDAVGAILIDGSDVTTVIASGGGRLATTVIQSVGTQIAASLGGVASVEDISPLPADDPGGTVLLFFLVLCTVGGFLSITAITQVFPRARTRSLVATAVGAAVLAPVIGFSIISLFVDYGVSFGTAMTVISIGMIYTFTVAIISTMLNAVLGQAAIFGQILLFVALNFPSAGSSSPESMLPPFWQVIHNGWLGSGAFESFRSILFFNGSDVGRWIAQLLIWTIAALALTALITVLKKRRGATKTIAVTAEHEHDEADRPASPVSADIVTTQPQRNQSSDIR